MVMEGFSMISGVALHRASDRKFSNVEKGDARRKRGGPRAKKRETEIEIAFNFSPIDDGDYGGAPPTPAPVAMFE